LPNFTPLGIQNGLNQYGGYLLQDNPGVGNDVYVPFIDVVGDNFFSPLDAQEIVNYINARHTSEGEGSMELPSAVPLHSGLAVSAPATAMQPIAAGDMSDLLALLALDVATQPKRRGS
jgi:hypothetical protein